MRNTHAIARLIIAAAFAFLATSAQAASSRDVIEAADILLQRGFAPHAIYNLVPYYDWRENRKFVAHLARKAGVSQSRLERQAEKRGHRFDSPRFDVETGLQIDFDKPVAMARSISLCYRNGRPRDDCKLRYHQLDGCYMRKRYRRACKQLGSIKSRYPKPGHGGFIMDCWVAPKGDLPVLPAKATKSKIDLKTARRTDTPKEPPATGNYLERKVCTSPVFQTETRKFIGPVALPDYLTSHEYTPRRPLAWCGRKREYFTAANGDYKERQKSYCGRDMALLFCEEYFYKGVASFKRQSGLSQTEFNFETSCTGNCDGFASVVCNKPEYIITGKLSEQVFPKPKPASQRQDVSASDIKGFLLRDNHDLAGDRLADLKGLKSVSACARQCKQKTGCVAFSYDKWNRWCFLKSAVASARLEPKSISGVLTGTGMPLTSSVDQIMRNYRGKNFPYDAYATRTEKTSDDCSQQCRRRSRCVAFSFVKANRSCRLFETVGEYFTKAGVDSGAKRQVTN